MRLQFLGAAHEVTGSCTLLQALGKNILIDCGMEQGPDIYENCEFPFSPGEIDYILLTHAHIDHSGKIPNLFSGGCSAPVYTTYATKKLCDIMLMDSAHIQEFEAKWRNRKARRSGKDEYTPLYTCEDVTNTLKHFISCGYDETYTLCDGIKVKFIDAGHLLGSASIEISITEKGETETLLFSGDLGNTDRPLINDPKQPKGADYVVIESTYGNRLHGERPNYITQLTKIIKETFDKGGNLIIPSFAVGRTQELLYLIRIIKEQNLIEGHKNFPVYIDSPLAVEAIEIYSGDIEDYYDKEALQLLEKGINPIKFPDLKIAVTSDESIAINEDNKPKIIISASGMCEAGRIRHHLKHNLWREESTILFVGYQAQGTLGRIIVEGTNPVRLFGEEITVRARIETLAGISGHADRDALLNWLGGFEKRPKTVYVNHGSDAVCDKFAKTVTERLGVEAIAPYNSAIYDLETASCIEEGITKRKEKRYSSFKDSTAFPRLLNAGTRLMAIIQKYRQCANKDIAKFADQIIAICNKWDR